MAERIVSPGVFTRENDQSFLEQGVAEIGGAFIGPAPKGPAFIPVIVESQNEFVQRFGSPDGNSYLPYTVQSYLREATRATIVRVLGLEGYSGVTTTSALVKVSGSAGERILAIVHPTISGSSIIATSASGDASSFFLELSGSTNTYFSASGISASGSVAASLQNVLGSNATSTKVGYAYAFFPEAADPSAGGIAVDRVYSELTTTGVTFDNVEYTNAYTPWIRSQGIADTKYDLFRVHTLNDGSGGNKDIKISIQSIKGPVISGSYGTFTLLVRGASDTDQQSDILETFENLNLDASSPDYIGRRIGNSAPFVDPDTNETYYAGDYPNKSKYIRIELGENISNIPTDSVPYGFGPVYAPVVATSTDLVVPQLVTTRWTSGSVLTGWTSDALGDSKIFYGYDFASANHTNWSYLNPLPTGAPAVNYLTSSGSIVTEFSLENLSPGEVNGTNVSLNENSHISYRKFTVPFQGGFDGFAPNIEKTMGSAISSTNTQGFNLAASTTSGSAAYIRAIDSLSNTEAFDINLLVLPGVNYEQHAYIVQYAIDMCEERQDCFYILDFAGYSAVVSTVTELANRLNTNYAAGYYPWIKILDVATNRLVWAPPSVVMPEVYAYNDNVAAEWFAPAGLNRGGIPGAVSIKSRLPRATRDELYENKVNPIVSFGGQGIVAFGQKTLQTQASALDRINVRRLLIEVKKYIASTANYLVFEQNTEATRNRFLSLVNPYLASIQERQGLYAFRVVMDTSNNTPDVIDRNLLVGQIYLKPTKTAEFIILEFNVLPTGAEFPTG